MELQGKKILITGGGGFLGTAMQARLKARGIPENNIYVPREEEGDLRIAEVCDRAVRGMDVVIHLAGVTGGVTFHRARPGSIFYDNLIMGVQCMDAARRAGVEKFVTAGSVAEYPSTAAVPFEEATLWDGYPDLVHAPYAVAKTMLLAQAQAYRAQYGFNGIHLLLTSMYGPGEKGDFVIPALIGRMEEAVEKGESSVAVWGTGNATRDFLYVEDAAEGIVRAAEQYDMPEPANLASGKETAIRDLAKTIARLVGYKGEIVFDPTKPDGAPRRVVGIRRARESFGFVPMSGLEDGLRATIAWHRGHPAAR